MAVWIHMYMYYINIGMLGFPAYLCLIVWHRSVGYGKAEDLLRSCEYPVDFFF